MKDCRKLRNLWKAHKAISSQRRLPRKMKKLLFGKVIKGRNLKKLLANVTVTQNKYPKQAGIEPYEFCPKCGCVATNQTENMATYPESWIKVFCARCGFLVATQDNSPWMHCLEFSEDNYCIN